MYGEVILRGTVTNDKEDKKNEQSQESRLRLIVGRLCTWLRVREAFSIKEEDGEGRTRLTSSLRCRGPDTIICITP